LTLALAGERTTEPIEIDNTAPTVSAVGAPQITGDKARAAFEATDGSSYITRAEYSINGGEWKPVYADDGIADSAKERFTVEFSTPAAGEYTVTIRVFDVNGNSGNSRSVVRR